MIYRLSCIFVKGGSETAKISKRISSEDMAKESNINIKWEEEKKKNNTYLYLNELNVFPSRHDHLASMSLSSPDI